MLKRIIMVCVFAALAVALVTPAAWADCSNCPLGYYCSSTGCVLQDSCYNTCASTWRACKQACGAGDDECLGDCAYGFADCTSACPGSQSLQLRTQPKPAQ